MSIGSEGTGDHVSIGSEGTGDHVSIGSEGTGDHVSAVTRPERVNFSESHVSFATQRALRER